MSHPANTVHGYHVTATRTGIAERVVNGHARAHERSHFLCRQVVRNRGQRFRARDHVLGISAVGIEAGDFPINAHREITPPALCADETMSTMPANADALTSFP